MNNRELCDRLIKSESEESVVDILKEANLWNTQWKPYGNNENNFSIIGSQQSQPDTALVEKLINSVDAVLTKACIDNGIDPESGEAPQSVPEATEKFFGVYKGKLANVDPRTRTKLAENIYLIASGKKTKPCFTIMDKGEGQHPENIENTFLSLAKSNKLRIPFVQGKFNMGSTGVLQFCGERNLQLIVTRRQDSDEWGFTVVRRDPPPEGVKSSVYTYLPIRTFKASNVKFQGKSIESGTLVKLYEYDIKGGLKSNIQFDLYYRLSLLMPSVALPIRIYEARKGYRGHTKERTLAGLSVRLEEDKGNNMESGFPNSAKLTVKGNELPVTIYGFKKDGARNYKGNEGIIFTVNGQTHGALTQSFFTRQSVRMGYLADSILVVVDCSRLEGKYREDLFMNSRDKLRYVEIRTEIERGLEELLSNHPGLRELRERRRREEIADRLKDNKPFVDILNDIIDTSPTLSSLFRTGEKINSPFNLEKVDEVPTFTGTQFPSHFELLKKYSEDNPKIYHKGERFRVQYSTDVENRYFTRDNDPGTFNLIMEDGKEVDAVVNLWDGYATVNVEIPSSAKSGDVLKFTSFVNDVSQVEPFVEDFYVKVINPKPTKGKKGKRKPPMSSQLALPNVIEVTQNDWGPHRFNEDSGMRVVDNGEDGYDFFINMANKYLLHELKLARSDEVELIKARYKYTHVLFALSTLNETREDEPKEYDVYSLIDKFSRIISPVLLPMLDYYIKETS